MSKKVIVHIGANKTGSSAIQKFLSLNCEALRKQGLVIPSQDFTLSSQVSGFHVFAFEELFRNPRGRQQLEAAMNVIADSQVGAKAILLSAENLAANPAGPALFTGLVEKFDVQIILYVRRQDEYILSSWQQWYSKVSDDFWAWAIGVAGTLGDWRAYLQRWEAVVPRAQITVRVFERARLDGGDAVLDFYNRLGLDAPFESMRYPQDKVNPSFSDAVMDLVKGNKLIFKSAHDSDFYNFVLEMTGDRYVRKSRQSSITFAQRLAILQKYADSNRWVQETYFGGGSGGLFSNPLESDFDHASPETMQAEKMEFLATLLYGLHKKGN
jgi:hypothetical protein